MVHVGRSDFTEALGLAIDIERVVRAVLTVASACAGKDAVSCDLQHAYSRRFCCSGEGVRKQRIDPNSLLDLSCVVVGYEWLGNPDAIDDPFGACDCTAAVFHRGGERVEFPYDTVRVEFLLRAA